MGELCTVCVDNYACLPGMGSTKSALHVKTFSFSTEAELWNWIVEIGIPQFFLTSGIFLRIPRQNSTFQIVEI